MPYIGRVVEINRDGHGYVMTEEGYLPFHITDGRFVLKGSLGPYMAHPMILVDGRLQTPRNPRVESRIVFYADMQNGMWVVVRWSHLTDWIRADRRKRHQYLQQVADLLQNWFDHLDYTLLEEHVQEYLAPRQAV